jgi:hypothetical protein
MNRKMRVAGKLLTPEPKEGKVRFQIRIPARYGFVTPAGEAAGSIDGAAYHGAVFLDAGEHEFIVAPPQPQLTVCWAQALERGFSPFPPR